jgi:SAM-dependent methyltransferase
MANTRLYIPGATLGNQGFQRFTYAPNHLSWKNQHFCVLHALRRDLSLVLARTVPPLAGKLKRPLVAADLGCGNQPYRFLVKRYAMQYIAIDLENNPLADISMDPVSAHVPLPSNTVDVILSTQVLEHVESPTHYLREARRLCSSHGILILSTHGIWKYHPKPADYWRWTASGLNKLLAETGWLVLDVHGVLGPLATALQLLQDTVAPAIPSSLRPLFTTPMQRVLCLADLFDPSFGKGPDNAAVLVAVAAKDDSSPCRGAAGDGAAAGANIGM